MRSQVDVEPFFHDDSPFVKKELEENVLFDMNRRPSFDEYFDVNESVVAEDNLIKATMTIQHAFHNYKIRKQISAATRIQFRFLTWKIRKDFLNRRRQAIRIQAFFWEFQVRRQHRKILWSVGALEKVNLCSINYARQLFDKIPDPDLRIWTICMSNLSQHEYLKEAISIARTASCDVVKASNENSLMSNDFSSVVSKYVQDVADPGGGAMQAVAMANLDNVSNVVSMLKGTLERKKLSTTTETEPIGDSTNGFYQPKEVILHALYNNGEGFFSSSLKTLSVIDYRDGIQADFPSVISKVRDNLVIGYVIFRRLHEALLLFDKMPQKNNVAWNSILLGFVDTGQFSEAMEVYHLMLSLNEARQAFEAMSKNELASWNAMIWRCFYDPSSSSVITDGFDSAIKVHQRLFSSVQEKGERLLNISVSSPMNELIIENLIVRVVLSEGSTSIYVSTPCPVKQPTETKLSHLDIVSKTVVVLEKINSVPEHNQYFQVYYKFCMLSMLREPLMLISRFFFFSVACNVYVHADSAISRPFVPYLARQQWDEVQTTIQQVHNIIHLYLATNNKLEVSLRDLSGTGDVHACKAARKAANGLVKGLLEELKPLLAFLQSSSSASQLLPKVEELRDQEWRDRQIAKHSTVVDCYEKQISGSNTKKKKLLHIHVPSLGVPRGI